MKDVIFSKTFRHNLIGTSTLGQAGVSTLLHEGKVYLIEAGSMGELPQEWKIRACEGIDCNTGLPFVTMKRSKPQVGANTMLSRETQERQDDVARARDINANRRAMHQSSKMLCGKRRDFESQPRMANSAPCHGPSWKEGSGQNNGHSCTGRQSIFL